MQTRQVSSGRALLLRALKVESIFVLMQFDIKDAIWKSPRHLWHDSSRLARKRGSVMNTKACQGRVGLEPRRSALKSLNINGYYRTTVITYVLSIRDVRAQRALYIETCHCPTSVALTGRSCSLLSIWRT